MRATKKVSAIDVRGAMVPEAAAVLMNQYSAAAAAVPVNQSSAAAAAVPVNRSTAAAAEG